MLHKIKGSYAVECDDCGNTHEDEDNNDFNGFIATIRELGWKSKKFGDDWLHTCPECLK